MPKPPINGTQNLLVRPIETLSKDHNVMFWSRSIYVSQCGGLGVWLCPSAPVLARTAGATVAAGQLGCAGEPQPQRATIQATLKVTPTRLHRQYTYSLLDAGEVDPGPLHQRGWAPLPEKPDVLPWAAGPLGPTSATFGASAAGELALAVPGLTFAIVDVSSPASYMYILCIYNEAVICSGRDRRDMKCETCSKISHNYTTLR